MTARLPDKPSDLIELALGDLEKCEAMPQVYAIDMGVWHCPTDFRLDGESMPPVPSDQTCTVCLAGSVLAQTINVPPTVHVPLGTGGPAARRYVDEATRDKLVALNDFRAGDVFEGLVRMGVSDILLERFECDNEDGFDVQDYEESPAEFKDDLRHIVTRLRRVGL